MSAAPQARCPLGKVKWFLVVCRLRCMSLTLRWFSLESCKEEEWDISGGLWPLLRRPDLLSCRSRSWLVLLFATALAPFDGLFWLVKDVLISSATDDIFSRAAWMVPESGCCWSKCLLSSSSSSRYLRILCTGLISCELRGSEWFNLCWHNSMKPLRLLFSLRDLSRHSFPCE